MGLAAGHFASVYELDAPVAEVAAMLAELSGNEVRYFPVGFDEFHAIGRAPRDPRAVLSEAMAASRAGSGPA
ncbi:hypothetical protein J7E25_09170 [Agromyces sp. ISL-38]|uniref:hypothetical protein n=1 Tax=Agromyces sp. ISL-38 TaxID=2819107 RepID=UPI001BE9E975|nr:hypothetical protein [Agromyces sp. ISL-38]MBT2499267.1 hypothetical protein [Agromyces sp. ISL-38]MBT2518196.1 hypothetical protein [Streptomyces sp. ISL-90]